MSLNFASPNLCCCCDLAKPTAFASWRQLTTSSPFYVSPPTDWTDEGSGAIRTTTLGKTVYPFEAQTSAKYRLSFTLDLDGVLQFGFIGGAPASFDSGAQTFSTPFNYSVCNIGAPPWEVLLCAGDVASVTVNGNDVICNDDLGGSFKQFKLQSGTFAKISNLVLTQRGTANGKNCGILCLPDAWYPRHSVDIVPEITVTIAGVANSVACGDCNLRNGTFVLPWYSRGTGEAIYRLAGAFGGGATYMQARFYAGALGDGTPVWYCELSWSGTFAEYYFKKFAAPKQPCGKTLNFTSANLSSTSPLNAAGNFGAATVAISY